MFIQFYESFPNKVSHFNIPLKQFYIFLFSSKNASKMVKVPLDMQFSFGTHPHSTCITFKINRKNPLSFYND